MRVRSQRAVRLVFALIGLSLGGGRVWANGAFPDSQQVLLPADRPNEIVVATNFGLVISEDNGATWGWVCEDVIAPLPKLFQVSATPDDTLYAVADATGLMRSTDHGCTWSAASGLAFVADAFADPSDPKHVLALSSLPGDAGTSQGLFESTDGGATFGMPRNVVGAEGYYTGVEVARSQPKTVYLTMFSNEGSGHSAILHSTDGGMTFTTYDASAALGTQHSRLAAVDPMNPDRIFLRVLNVNGDLLGVSDDAGKTLRLPVMLKYPMSTLLIRSNGDVLVASTAEAFRSTDGGMTFSQWPNAPHLRALGERDGILYGVADDIADGFALASTTDNGAHWKPLMRFDQITGPIACPNVQKVCAPLWPAQKAKLKPPVLDMNPMLDGGMETPADMASSPPPPPLPPKKKSHGCDYLPAGGSPWGAWLLLIGLGGWLMVRRRGRGSSSRRHPD